MTPPMHRAGSTHGSCADFLALPHQHASALDWKNNTEAKRLQNYFLMWLINHPRAMLAVLSADSWSQFSTHRMWLSGWMKGSSSATDLVRLWPNCTKAAKILGYGLSQARRQPAPAASHCSALNLQRESKARLYILCKMEKA